MRLGYLGWGVVNKNVRLGLIGFRVVREWHTRCGFTGLGIVKD